MRKYALLLLLSTAALAQPPLYMRKAKEIQAQARTMNENSRAQSKAVEPADQSKVLVAQKQNPVIKAASGGQINELELLEQKGHSLAASDSDGNTALHVAAYKGQKEVVEYLLAKPGLLKDPVDNWGITPLMLAASAGHTKVVEVLLTAGCDYHLKSGDGSSALHRAAAQGRLGAVELLLAAGANPTLVDGKGKTPLELAESKKKGDWQSVVSKLKQASAESQP